MKGEKMNTHAVPKKQGMLKRMFRLNKRDSKPVAAPAAMLPHYALSRELQRQRALADRTGSSFVFLQLHIVHKDHKRQDGTDLLGLLAHVVSERSRLSDVFGWHGTNNVKVGLILPDTTRHGAMCVVRNVESLFQKEAMGRGLMSHELPELVCDLFVYPLNLRHSAAHAVEEGEKLTIHTGELLGILGTSPRKNSAIKA
jgi:hypothetical protein